MEPVSLTATIVALLDTAQKVIRFLNEIKDAPSDRDKFLLEAQSSCLLLWQLRDRLTAKAAAVDQAWFRHFTSLVGKDSILDQYQSCLNEVGAKLEKLVNKRRSQSLRLTVGWKTEKMEMEGIFQRMERCKSTIAIALSNDTFTVSMSTGEMIRNVKENQDRGTKDQHKKAVLDWIEKSATRYDVLQHDYISRAQDGTGTWFLNSQTFQQWIHAPASTLYCPGIPGAGKTIMTSIATKYLESHFPRADHNIAAVYFNYNRKNEQSHVQLLFSILWQFVCQRTEMPSPLDEFHKKHERSGPDVKDLLNLLVTLVQENSFSFLLLDALDEFSNDGNGRSEFLHHISKLKNTVKLHIMMTFRPNTEIPSVLTEDASLPIHAAEEDLKSYIRQRLSQMESLPDCVDEDDDFDILQDKVVNKIAEACDGMFLLAKLHSDSLQDAFTIDEIEETLESLSTGESAITDAYNSAIHRIDMQRPKRQELAHQVIAWIVHSHRPLSPIELRTALAIKPGNFKDPKRNLPGIKTVLAVCAGLVVLDEETRVIRLVHYTTQEYFSKGKLQDWLPGIEIEIARSCVTYLLIPDLYKSILQHHEEWNREEYCGRRVENRSVYRKPYYILPSVGTPIPLGFWSDVERWPFFVYAIKHWGSHCQPVQEELEATAMDFLSNPEALALYWTHQMIWDYVYVSDERYFLKQFQLGKPGPISVAAGFGLDRYLEKLLRKTHIYETSEWLLVPEKDFLLHGHLSAGEHMVEQHPLVLASYGGYHRAASILLEHTYTAEQDLYRAIRTACSKDYTEIFELLLSHWPLEEVDLKEIAQYDIIDSEKSQELLLSSNLKNTVKSLRYFVRRQGASSWISFLLKKDWDAEVDENGSERQWVLWRAASQKCLKNLQLLLVHPKFDLALETVRRGSLKTTTIFEFLLAKAIPHANHKAVHFLLESRPRLDPGRMHTILEDLFERANSRASDFSSGIFISSNEKRFRELCVNETSGNNLLRCLKKLSSVACDNFHIQYHRGLVSEINERIRRELLDHSKIDPNKRLQDGDSRTPISYAAAAQDNSVAVKLLLKHPGVDADSRDGSGRTPLSHAASVTDNSTTVRLFLDHPGIDPNSTDSKGWTPLSWAIFGGCVESVRALLDHTGMSQMECKRAATLRLAELWLGWKRELGLSERSHVDFATQDEEDNDGVFRDIQKRERAIVSLLEHEIEQLCLKQYSIAVSNGALVLALLEEYNADTS